MSIPITIVTVSDNQFCVMLAALVKSLELNLNHSYHLEIYVVSDGISKENIQKLQVSTSKSTRLKFLDINSIVKERRDLPLDSTSFPLNVYVRLLIPNFIEPNVNRVIYLDVDMINKRDISELWNMELQGKVLAAAVDRSEIVGSSWGGIPNYKALGLDPNAKYFNSGLLIIDVQAWRMANYAQEIFSCINTNKKYATYPDQYGLNVVFNGKWLELDQRWNCFAQSTILDPYNIHFIGVKPIFKTYKNNEGYKDEFFFYLNMTEWKNFEVLSESNRVLKKLKNLLIKKVINYLPKRNDA